MTDLSSKQEVIDRLKALAEKRGVGAYIRKEERAACLEAARLLSVEKNLDLAEYLQEGETPTKCIERNRRDASRALEMLGMERQEIERLRTENADLRKAVAGGRALIAELRIAHETPAPAPKERLKLVSVGGKDVTFRLDDDGELIIEIEDYTDAIMSVPDMQRIAEWLRPSPETSRDAEDAAKWRALRGSARITAIGAAGLGAHRRKPNHYAHLTLNFWTVHDAPADALALEWLDEYVEIAQRAQGAAEKTSVPPASCVHEWWTDSDGDHHCTKCGATNMQSLKASVPHAMQSHTMQCRSNYFDFQAKAPYPCNCALNGTVPHE
jgi:hypothetical protein